MAGTSGVGQQGFDQLTNLVASFGGDGATPAARMSNPYPYGPIKPPGGSLGLLNDVGYTAYGPIRDISNKVPYEQSGALACSTRPGGILFSTRPTSARRERIFILPMQEITAFWDVRSSTSARLRSPI